METRDIITGLIIGALLGAAVGYTLWAGRDAELQAIDTLEMQISELTDQQGVNSVITASLEAQLEEQAEIIQGKNTQLINLRSEITSLEQELQGLQFLIPESPEHQNVILGMWECDDMMQFMQGILTEPFQVSQNTLILRWIVNPADTGGFAIILVDEATEDHVTEIIIDPASTGIQEIQLTPGSYFIYAVGDVGFTIIALEAAS